MSESTKKPNQLAVYDGTEYAITRSSISELPSILDANIGSGNDINEFDMDRVSVPAGGGLAWSVPDINGEPQPEKELVGVILLHGDRRVYWEKSFDETGAGSPPDCSSLDSRNGFGIIRGGDVPESRACKTCPMSQWGSGKPDDDNDNSQACSQRKIAYLIREDDILPLIIDLAPTSVREFNRFMLRLVSRGIPCWSAVVAVGLRQEQSTGNVKYSVAMLRLVSRLPDDQAAKMHAAAQAMKPYFDKTDAAPMPQDA